MEVVPEEISMIVVAHQRQVLQTPVEAAAPLVIKCPEEVEDRV